MKDLCNLIDSKHNDVEIKYDFGELPGFDYENGILYIYIENDSHEVAIGGQYNFDEDSTGIGFSVDVRYLLETQDLSEKLVNNSENDT